MLSDEEIDRHRESVIALSKAGGPLSPAGSNSSIRNPEWFVAIPGKNEPVPLPERRRLHRRMVNDLINDSPSVTTNKTRPKGERARAVVMAGPPGAGKSTIRRQILGDSEPEYLRIDADLFKEQLLRQAIKDGSYAEFIKPEEVKKRERYGEQFQPMELASLVHEESSLIAKLARATAINEEMNIVVDTVLSSEESARQLINELKTSGRYDVEIVDVEVPFEVSESRIRDRWLASYRAAENDPEQLGGRWVPSEYARAVYSGPEGRSKPSVVSRKIAAENPVVSRYRQYFTSSEQAFSDSMTKTQSVPEVQEDLCRSSRSGKLVKMPRSSRQTSSESTFYPPANPEQGPTIAP